MCVYPKDVEDILHIACVYPYTTYTVYHTYRMGMLYTHPTCAIQAPCPCSTLLGYAYIRRVALQAIPRIHPVVHPEGRYTGCTHPSMYP
jgi:hypothetical protein